VVVLPTETPFTTLPTLAPLTATAAAEATIAALAGGGGSPTATALPSTGFAEDIGLPNLVLLAAVLLAVIIVARQVRSRAVS
jgi:hypothetical protein